MNIVLVLRPRLRQVLVLLISLLLTYSSQSYNKINIIQTVNNTKDFNYIYNLYTVYGNELFQSHIYFSIIDSSNYMTRLEQESFKEYYKCFINSFNVALDCVVQINKKYESITPIVHEYIDSYTNNSVIKSGDCEYLLSLFDVKLQKSHYYYSFVLIEYKCKSHFNIPGGSSFETFAVTSNYLSTCKQITSGENSIYTIICSIPKEYIDMNISTYSISHINICMNLTIILSGMHFDNFNELLRNDSNTYYFRVLTDNKQYCYNSSKLISFDKFNSKFINNNFNMSKCLWYFTGIWTNDSRSTDLYTYSYSRHMSASRLQYTMLHFNSSQIFGPFPYLFYHFQYNDFYNFQPKIITTINSSMIESKLLSLNTSVAIELLSNPKNEFYFLGASHMRYNFDGLAMFLYGDEVLNNLDRKHGYVSINNMIDLSTPKSFTPLFADDQSDFLINKCAEFTIDIYDRKNKIILFQTGSWDLQQMPLGRVLRAKETGLKLMSTISKILSGEISCGNLDHFIWITSVPYPVCMHDDDNACSQNSGHRTNPAFSALNQFYLKHLMKVNVTNRIRLSIVDAYSILKPRVILNRYYEFVCYCHFLCRMAIHGNIPTLIHTPGGDALLNSLILALVSKLL